MADKEYCGKRYDTYSTWHRTNSIARFIGLEKAKSLACCDIDHCVLMECKDKTSEVVGLIEVARDIGQAHKAASFLGNLGIKADIPVYVALYLLSDQPNPADPEVPDIRQFRIKRIHPKPESEWRTLTPPQYAEFLCKIREFAEKRHAAKVQMDENLHPVSQVRPV